MSEKPDKLEELRKVRIQKLEQLRKQGIDPYPVDSHRTHLIGEGLKNFDELSKAQTEVVLAGRIKSIRTHGKLAFFDLEDESGRIQLLMREDDMGEHFKLIELLDLGDFIEAYGTLNVSKTGQNSLFVKKLRLLSKSILPIPTEHFGIEDLELRLRKRYLDLLLNPDTRELFRKKSIFWKTIRKFLEEQGFLEVHLNVLEPVPGGAEAEPFITHHKALDRDFYLRISLELPLKKLVVGGFEKVYEIGRIFRNEGISTEHLQDYSQMEFYWAYSEYNQLMDAIEEMYKQVIANVTGGLKTTYDGKEIDWSGKWAKVRYFDVFKEKTGMDLNEVSDDELKKYADKEHK